ncbi:transcriptional repressor [Yimella sp. cx-573]|nr:transcriptional repressor [Yimella sp. cx-573]
MPHTPSGCGRCCVADVEMALALLRSKGERVTKARRAVLRALAERPHQDAESVAALVASADPGVHRATIYRNLQSLVDAGVVSHTHVPDAATIYHLSVTGHRHTHLQCVQCGCMVDIPLEWVSPLGDRVRDELGFELDAGHAALLGTCQDCAAS